MKTTIQVEPILRFLFFGTFFSLAIALYVRHMFPQDNTILMVAVGITTSFQSAFFTHLNPERKKPPPDAQITTTETKTVSTDEGGK
jgi:hypothetical protein